MQGRKHIHAVVDFVRDKLPGFERCYVIDVAPQTGVRQTRLLEGEYVMTKDDLAQRTRFDDSVARGRDYYTPYRALLPRSVDNLLVAGPPLLGDLGGAEDVARDPAVHGDGRSRRRRRGAGARRGRIGAQRRRRARCRRPLRAQGADPGDQTGRNADVPALAVHIDAREAA